MQTWELCDEQPWNLKGNSWKKTTKTNYGYNGHFETGLSGEQTFKRRPGKSSQPEKKTRNKLEYDTQLFRVSTLHPLLVSNWLWVKREQQYPSTESPWWKGSLETTNSDSFSVMKFYPDSRTERSLSSWLSRLRHLVRVYVSFFNQHIFHEVRLSNCWTFKWSNLLLKRHQVLRNYAFALPLACRLSFPHQAGIQIKPLPKHMGLFPLSCAVKNGARYIL